MTVTPSILASDAFSLVEHLPHVMPVTTRLVSESSSHSVSHFCLLHFSVFAVVNAQCFWFNLHVFSAEAIAVKPSVDADKIVYSNFILVLV